MTDSRKRPQKARVKMPGGEVREMTVGPDIDLEQEVIHDEHGNRIDQAYIDAVLDDRARYVGRPSLSAPGTRSPQIGVRLPAALKTAVDARAEREGRKPSALIREAIEQYLAG